MYGYEWTKEYGIFRLTIDAKVQKEIRPVFHEELDYFGMDAYLDGRELKMHPHRVFKNIFLKLYQDEKN